MKAIVVFNVFQMPRCSHLKTSRPGDSHTQNGGLEQLFESDLP